MYVSVLPYVVLLHDDIQDILKYFLIVSEKPLDIDSALISTEIHTRDAGMFTFFIIFSTSLLSFF